MNLISKISDILRKELCGKVDNVDFIINLIHENSNSDFLMFNENGEIHVADPIEFLWVESKNKQLIFHTLQEMLTPININAGLEDYIKKNFVELRKGVFVNMSKVTKYHSYENKLFFTENYKEGKHVLITSMNMSQYVMKALGSEHNLADVNPKYSKLNFSY